MQWIKVSDSIPAPAKGDIVGSEELLCQDEDGRTFIGIVLPGIGNDQWWLCRGQGDQRYTLRNIVRWISLKEALTRLRLNSI